MYRVTIDTDACEGIFACLVRDERFVESDEGLATFDAESRLDDDIDSEMIADTDSEMIADTDSEIVAEFDDSRREDAEQAAAACPPGAITVEEVKR